MSQELIHRDLRRNLRNKIRLAAQDHIDLCDIADIPAPHIACGIAETFLNLLIQYFIKLELTPQQFGQICHDSYKEFQEHQQEREV